MDSQVPWRCLVPADAVSFIIGKGGANIRQISETSGAEVAISKEGETPETLADKIVTVKGSNNQKESACAQILRKLRQMQGVSDHEPGVFVIIVPQISAPVIIGAKGAQIKSIMEHSGAEINVGREAIINMADQPISINGTINQVIAAVSKLNSVLQDMLDRGKLAQRDFIVRPLDASAVAFDEPPRVEKPAEAPAVDRSAPPTYSGGGGGVTAPYPGGSNTGGCGGWEASPSPAPAAAVGGSTSSTSFGGPGNGSSGAQQTIFGGQQTSVGGQQEARSGGQQTSFGGGQGAQPTSFGGSSAQQTSFGGNQGTQQTSFGGNQGAQQTSFGGPNGQQTSFGGNPGAQQSFGATNGQQSSFGGGTPTSFGGMGSMGGMGGMMGGAGGGMGTMYGGMGGLGGMGGMGGMGNFGGFGMGGMNPMMGGMGMGMMGGMGSPNERAFMQALQASGINSSELTLLLPQVLVQNILVPRGIMAEIAQRSGAKIDLGAESPPGMRQVTLSGPMVANALASLFLQEKVIQFQQMGGGSHMG